MIDGGVQRVPQGPDVPSDLSEEHAPLVGGDEHVGKPHRVGRRVDAAEPLHPFESFTEDVSPLLEDARQLVVNVEIGLDDLAREGAEAATVLERATGEDVEVRPVLKRVDAVEACEPFAAVESEDAVRLPVDDGEDEALLVREVVGEL